MGGVQKRGRMERDGGIHPAHTPGPQFHSAQQKCTPRCVPALRETSRNRERRVGEVEVGGSRAGGRCEGTDRLARSHSCAKRSGRRVSIALPVRVL